MKTIVVGVDGSPRAAGVLRAAVDLAVAIGARLTIVRAVGIPAGMPAEAMTLDPQGLPALLLDHARKELDALLTEEVPKQWIGATDVQLGTPWQVLCETAARIGAEYVVVGTHGYTMLDRVLGTTAARVVNHAPCSVLVVRDKAAQK